MHNFTFDDLKDYWFIHDFEVQKLIAPNNLRLKLDFEKIRVWVFKSESKIPMA
jgi:hypothetical protein